jgi:hypothetical protein
MSSKSEGVRVLGDLKICVVWIKWHKINWYSLSNVTLVICQSRQSIYLLHGTLLQVCQMTSKYHDKI